MEPSLTAGFAESDRLALILLQAGLMKNKPIKKSEFSRAVETVLNSTRLFTEWFARPLSAGGT